MYYSLSRLLRKLRQKRELGIFFLVAVLCFSIIGNTLTFYIFEQSAETPPTIWDSLWYSVISITTIGFGDFFAEELGSRLGTAIFIILVGLAAFTTTIGLLVDWIVDLRQKERRGMGRQQTREHLIIVNFPSESRVRQIIEEFTRDEHHRDREVTVVTDQIDELPFGLPNLSFVRGSPLRKETFERANLKHAGHTIVLSPSYDDARSDSLVASIAFLIESMNPEISIIVECLDPEHDVLFEKSDQVSLVYTLRMANNLLVQEAQDHGVNLLTQAITSNVPEIEETLASTPVTDPPSRKITYTDVAKKLLDNSVNLLGIVRQGEVFIGFEDLVLTEKDVLVYISKQRQTWKSLSPMLG